MSDFKTPGIFTLDKDITAFHCQCVDWFGFTRSFKTHTIATSTVPKYKIPVVSTSSNGHIIHSVRRFRTDKVTVNKIEIAPTENDGFFKDCDCYVGYNLSSYEEGKTLKEDVDTDIFENRFTDGVDFTYFI